MFPFFQYLRPTPRWRRRRAPLLMAGLAAGIGVRFGWRPGVVVGDSMSPTLRSGQWFLLEPGAYREALPRRGEIVVFRHGGHTYVKRVLGAAGDSVWLLERTDPDGRTTSPITPDLLENARQLHERRLGWRLFQVRVPQGCVYVVGDMVSRSIDSRHLGPIPVRELQGRVRLLHRAPPFPRLHRPPPRPS